MERQHERRVPGITAASTGRKSIAIVWHNQAEEEERDNVEQTDTPEDLLCGFRNGLTRIHGFGSSETHEFCSTKGERCSDEDGAEALESVCKSPGIMPVTGSNITSFIRWNAATIDNDSQEDEANNGYDLDRTEYEFNLAISSDTENIDQDDQDKEDCDPHTDVDRWVTGILWIGP